MNTEAFKINQIKCCINFFFFFILDAFNATFFIHKSFKFTKPFFLLAVSVLHNCVA